MGRRKDKDTAAGKSHTLPSSPTHSSSSSDFEFTISLSPRKASSITNNNLCPADELFYKGQLLPLHLSPRISMVRTLLLAASSTSSSSDNSASTTTTASRDSTGSSSNDSQYSSFSSDVVLLADSCDSSRPSSVTEEDEFKRLNTAAYANTIGNSNNNKKTKYFSRFSRFSSVFRKESNRPTTARQLQDPYNSNNNNNAFGPSPPPPPPPSSSSSVKRMSATAKEVIRKYLKKVKPLYEKLSQRHQQQQKMGISANVTLSMKSDNGSDDQSGKRDMRNNNINNASTNIAHSFSGNLRYPRRRRRSCASSCPSSMRSSPSHSGILSRTGYTPPMSSRTGSMYYGDTSTMEELQNAIQGAIAHCKNSMLPNNKPIVVSHEI